MTLDRQQRLLTANSIVSRGVRQSVALNRQEWQMRRRAKVSRRGGENTNAVVVVVVVVE